MLILLLLLFPSCICHTFPLPCLATMKSILLMLQQILCLFFFYLSLFSLCLQFNSQSNCACTCLWCARMCDCLCTEGRWCPGHHSVCLFETGSLTESGVRLKRPSVVLPHPATHGIARLLGLHFSHVWVFVLVLGSKLRSLHLCKKCSYSLSYLPSSCFRC